MKTQLTSTYNFNNQFLNVFNEEETIIKNNNEKLMANILKSMGMTTTTRYVNAIYKLQEIMNTGYSNYRNIFILKQNNVNHFYKADLIPNENLDIEMVIVNEMNEKDFFELFNSQEIDLPDNNTTKEIGANKLNFYNSIYLYN